MSVAREAGSRTKIAVLSRNPDVDSVGACIGARGIRVAKIVDELGGEKIDIIEYKEKPEEYIAAALSPASVVKVEIIDEEAKSCCVTVPDSQLSLAIGNKGQNARLAAKLTKWKVDIRPKSGFYGEENDGESSDLTENEDTSSESTENAAVSEDTSSENTENAAVSEDTSSENTENAAVSEDTSSENTENAAVSEDTPSESTPDTDNLSE